METTERASKRLKTTVSNGSTQQFPIQGQLGSHTVMSATDPNASNPLVRLFIDCPDILKAMKKYLIQREIIIERGIRSIPTECTGLQRLRLTCKSLRDSIYKHTPPILTVDVTKENKLGTLFTLPKEEIPLGLPPQLILKAKFSNEEELGEILNEAKKYNTIIQEVVIAGKKYPQSQFEKFPLEIISKLPIEITSLEIDKNIPLFQYKVDLRHLKKLIRLNIGYLGRAESLLLPEEIKEIDTEGVGEGTTFDFKLYPHLRKVHIRSSFNTMIEKTVDFPASLIELKLPGTSSKGNFDLSNCTQLQKLHLSSDYKDFKIPSCIGYLDIGCIYNVMHLAHYTSLTTVNVYELSTNAFFPPTVKRLKCSFIGEKVTLDLSHCNKLLELQVQEMGSSSQIILSTANHLPLKEKLIPAVQNRIQWV